MTKVALYVRVSTEEQAKEGMSISAQLQALRQWASAKDYEVAGEYVDPGHTGRDDERPQFKLMMFDAERGKFEIVAVSKLDRFMRNIGKMCQRLDELDRLGIAFVPLDYPQLDTSTAVGKMTLSVLGAVAQFESDRNSERVKDVRRALLAAGRLPAGRSTYGYQWNADARRFEIVEDEAEIIRLIFDRYVNGNVGLVRVAIELNEAGHRTRPRRTRTDKEVKPHLWHPHSVGDILKDQRYIGRDEHLHYPPIISESLFEAAQRKLSVARKVRRDPGGWLLQGLVACGLCGHGLRCQQRRNEKRAYVCRGVFQDAHLDGTPRCSLRAIPGEPLERAVWHRFAQAISNGDVLRHSIEQAIKELERKKKGLGDDGPVDSELGKIQQRKERLWDAYEEGGMPKERFLAKVAELEVKEKEVKARRDRLDPMTRLEVTRLEEHIALAKEILTQGTIRIDGSGVTGLLFDQDDVPATHLHDLHDLWAGRTDSDEIEARPSPDMEIDGKTISFSADWWEWADKERMRRQRELLDSFQISIKAFTDRIEIHGLIPTQVIERQCDPIFRSA